MEGKGRKKKDNKVVSRRRDVLVSGLICVCLFFIICVKLLEKKWLISVFWGVCRERELFSFTFRLLLA